MTTPIDQSNLIEQLAASSSLNASKLQEKSLEQADFLKILTAQLQNQDPTSPQDQSEFLGQMAQFSSVQGIQDLTKSIDNMNIMTQSNQALQATSLIGKYVSIESNTGFLDQNATLDGFVNTGNATNANLEIIDKNGSLLKTIPLTSDAEGKASYSWDGKAEDGSIMPAGNYYLQAKGILVGETTQLAILVNAKVKSVNLSKSSEDMTLDLQGLGKAKMADITQISG